MSELTARDRLGATGAWLASLATVPAAEGAAAAREIERLGYGALWFGETPAGKEAYVHAGLLLAATERIVVATGIANIWARDARATVNATEALGEAHPGRFLLGLGVSHAPLVTMRGHDYAKPLAAMTAYLDGMAAASEGYGGPRADPPVPVVLAALRPKMVELARDRTAGAHPYLVTPEHTARTRALLGSAPLLAPEQAIVLEQEPELAREVARDHLKIYLTLPNYTRNLETLGFDASDFADGGSDRLVDALVAWGDAETVAARIAAHREAGADHVTLQPLAPTIAGQLEQLAELAPLLTR
jgi:probable F420-dependent oxidoreductase